MNRPSGEDDSYLGLRGRAQASSNPTTSLQRRTSEQGSFKAVSTASQLNPFHKRRLLASAQHVEKLLGEIEEILRASDNKGPFRKYRPDLSLHQTRLVKNYIGRLREHLAHTLAAIGIELPAPRFSSLHALRVTLSFIRIAVQEMAPEHLRGYGELPQDIAASLRGITVELEGLLNSLEKNLVLGSAADLQARLERLEQTFREAELLKTLDRIIETEKLLEFRNSVLNLAEKLEAPAFEVAVFGRVSSGKSSLLNRILEWDVLPVGVNPITAVPTRIMFGPEPKLKVAYLDHRVEERPIGELERFASEEHNPANELGVARLTVELPSPRLTDGLIFVDTPGLGALATEGAAETLSYLPQCDHGIVLVSAVSPINEEDLNTLQALTQAGIPAMVLLSKADLISPNDLEKALRYTRNEIETNLGLHLDVYPVSTLPSSQPLLRRWLDEQLQPLLERHQELSRKSIRRKIGALKESVASALRLKLRQAEASLPSLPAPIEEIEHNLRLAAARIEETRHLLLQAADEVAHLGRSCLDQSLHALFSSPNHHASPTELAAFLRDFATKRANDAAARISSALTDLATTLQDALSASVDVLPDQNTADQESLLDFVREMPRFEIALPHLPALPGWLSYAGSFAPLWYARRLRATCAPAFTSAFNTYSRSLLLWSRKVLDSLQNAFETRAEALRAQIARLQSASELTPEHREQLERQLAELESWGSLAATPEVRQRSL